MTFFEIGFRDARRAIHIRIRSILVALKDLMDAHIIAFAEQAHELEHANFFGVGLCAPVANFTFRILLNFSALLIKLDVYYDFVMSIPPGYL